MISKQTDHNLPKLRYSEKTFELRRDNHINNNVLFQKKLKTFQLHHYHKIHNYRSGSKAVSDSTVTSLTWQKAHFFSQALEDHKHQWRVGQVKVACKPSYRTKTRALIPKYATCQKSSSRIGEAASGLKRH